VAPVLKPFGRSFHEDTAIRIRCSGDIVGRRGNGGSPADFLGDGHWICRITAPGGSRSPAEGLLEGAYCVRRSVNPFDHVYFDGDKIIATRTRASSAAKRAQKRKSSSRLHHSDGLGRHD